MENQECPMEEFSLTLDRFDDNLNWVILNQQFGDINEFFLNEEDEED